VEVAYWESTLATVDPASIVGPATEQVSVATGTTPSTLPSDRSISIELTTIAPSVSTDSSPKRNLEWSRARSSPPGSGWTPIHRKRVERSSEANGARILAAIGGQAEAVLSREMAPLVGPESNPKSNVAVPGCPPGRLRLRGAVANSCWPCPHPGGQSRLPLHPDERGRTGAPSSGSFNWFSTSNRLCSAEFKTILSFIAGQNR